MYFCSLWVNAIEVAEHSLNNLEILEALFMHKHLANLWIYSMHIGKNVEFFIVGYTIVYSIVCFRMFCLLVLSVGGQYLLMSSLRVMPCFSILFCQF